MKLSVRSTWKRHWLWVLFFADLFLFVVLGKYPLTDNNTLLVMTVFTLSVIGLVILTSALTIRHQRVCLHWPVWLSLIGLFLVATFVQSSQPYPSLNVATMTSTLFLISVPALVIIASIKFFQKDIGLMFCGWLSLVATWALLIGWISSGNLLDPALESLEGIRVTPAPSWPGTLMSAVCCIMPLALMSFVWHTGVILRREVYRIAPPSE